MIDKYHIPKYQLIEREILEKIQTRILRALDPLPSEKDLCHQFSASRSTVRVALDHLLYTGKIFRVPGKGSFVAARKIDQSLSQLFSFSEKMKAQGYSVRTKLIGKEVVIADEKISGTLLLKPGERVIKIERLRLVDEQSMVLQLLFVPLVPCRPLLNEDLESQSLTMLLGDKCGIHLHRIEMWVESCSPSKRDRRLLGNPKLPHFLMVEGIAYDINDMPMRFSKGIFRGDRIRLKISDYKVEYESSSLSLSALGNE